jgi:hypothetical protein
MVIVPHALTGAVMGLASGSTETALASGIASHYLLDQIPHRDYAIEPLYGKALIAAELATAAFLLRRLTGGDRRALAGAVGGLLPDVVAVLAPRSAPSRLHARLHPDFTGVGRGLGVATQLVTATGAVWALRTLARRGVG